MRRFNIDWNLVFVLVLPLLLFAGVLAGKLPVMTDVITDGIYTAYYVAEGFRKMAINYWNPYLFYGVPTFPTMHIVFYPFYLLLAILPVKTVFAYYPVIHMMLAGLGMYLLVRELVNDRRVALFGAIAYSMSPIYFGYVYSGHLGKLSIYALLPFYFMLLRRTIRRPDWRNTVLLTFLIFLIVLVFHAQIIYYLVLFSVLYAIYELYFLFREGNVSTAIRAMVAGLISVAVAFLLSSGQIFMVLDYLQHYSQRGQIVDYKFATSWALGWQDWISTFVGGFSGFDVQSQYSAYWGPNAFKINSEYMGVIVFLLFIVGFVAIRDDEHRRLRNFLIFSFILFSIIALGGATPLYKLIWNILPAYKKFRAPSMAFYLSIFSAIIVASMTLKSVMEDGRVLRRREVLLFALPVLLLIFWLIASPSTLASLFAVSQKKLAILYQQGGKVKFSIFMAVVFSGLAAYLLWAYSRKSISSGWLVYSIAGLTLVDLWLVDKNFVQYVRDEYRIFGEDGVLSFLKKNRGPYKVYPYTYRTDENIFIPHHIETIGGHHGIQPARLFQIIGAGNALMFNPITSKNLVLYPHLNDILSIKYIATRKLPRDVNEPIIQAFFKLIDSRGYRKVYDDGFYEIYENPGAMPSVYVLGSYVVSKDPLQDVLHFSGKVVLEEEPHEKFDNGSVRYSLKFEKYTTDRVVARLNLEKGGYVIFAQNYHHRWKALVDGKPVKVLRANFIQMAVPVDAGEHVVEFYYDSSFDREVMIYTIAGLLLMSILSVVSVRRKRG